MLELPRFFGLCLRVRRGRAARIRCTHARALARLVFLLFLFSLRLLLLGLDPFLLVLHGFFRGFLGLFVHLSGRFTLAAAAAVASAALDTSEQRCIIYPVPVVLAAASRFLHLAVTGGMFFEHIAEPLLPLVRLRVGQRLAQIVDFDRRKPQSFDAFSELFAFDPLCYGALFSVALLEEFVLLPAVQGGLRTLHWLLPAVETPLGLKQPGETHGAGARARVMGGHCNNGHTKFTHGRA